MKNVLISFDGNAENVFLNFLMYLQIASTDVYSGYPKLKSTLEVWSGIQSKYWVASQEQHYKMML